MARIKNIAVVLTAAEAARQWALNNPEKAQSYIDTATGFIDQRTHGKYHSQIDSLSTAAKKNLTGQQNVSSSATRPFPDARA